MKATSTMMNATRDLESVREELYDRPFDTTTMQRVGNAFLGTNALLQSKQ